MTNARAADAASDPLAFAFRAYRAVAAESAGKNVLISPYSVNQALGLAYLGSKGETQQAFARVLGLPAPAAYAAAQKSARAARGADDGSLSVANSLWLRAGWNFRAAYVKSAREDLGAAAFRRDFDAKTLAEINAWTSDATRGRIPKILDVLNRDCVAVLVNAIDFKAAWETPFDAARTEPADFHPASGPAFLHPMMERGGMFAYAEREGLQVATLPYGDDLREMTVVLPARGRPLPELDAASWRALLAERKYRRGFVHLPRFRFDYSTELAEALSALGLAVAFDPARADFGGMAEARSPEERQSISRVIHKTFIAVDESGTEAGAATAVAMRAGSAPPRDEPFQFVADRPFLFAIVDSRLPEPLFLGAVQDPR
jgi:serpin B